MRLIVSMLIYMTLFEGCTLQYSLWYIGVGCVGKCRKIECCITVRQSITYVILVVEKKWTLKAYCTTGRYLPRLKVVRVIDNNLGEFVK